MNHQTCERAAVAASETIDELEDHIQSRLMGKILDFRLALTENGLILRGHAHTYYAKQLAQHALMEATEFPILANEIEVD